MFFFFNDTATTEIYTLSLHDALPIFRKSLSNQRIRRFAREKVSQKDKCLRDPARKIKSKCKQLFIWPVRFFQSISVSPGGCCEAPCRCIHRENASHPPGH